MGIKQKLTKIALTGLMAVTFSSQASATSLVISTIKHPDLYTGNQSWFRFYENPGETIKDSIILKNLGTESETVNLYPTDATANQSGSFSLKMQSEEQKGIGLWTRLDSTEVTLKPNESKEVGFQISIPKNLSPGEYFGGIINEKKTDNNCDTLDGNGNKKLSCVGNIIIKTRTGNRIYLTIPGQARQDIVMKDLSWKESPGHNILFHLNFVNNGNIAFEPKAIISIYDMSGNKIDSVEKSLGKSLPGTTINPLVEWKYKNKFGSFKANVEIFYKEDDQGRFNELHGVALMESRELRINITPWELVFSILASLLILTGIYLASIWKLKTIKRNALVYEVMEDENLLGISDKFKCNWRILAMLNRIKAPFVVSRGQKLLIPGRKNK